MSISVRRNILHFLLIIVAILSRLLVFTFAPHHIANIYDSVDYGKYAKQILYDRRIQDVFNPVRPPLYPLILAISFAATGVGKTYNIYDALNGNGGAPVGLFQTMVGIVSVIIFYLTLKQVMNVYVAWGFSLLYATSPLIIPWDRYILTESLSISLGVLFFSSAVFFLQKATVRRSIIFILFGLLCVWLRSLYLALVPLVLLIFILRLRTVRSIVQAYFLGMLFCLPILFHMHINDIFYGNPTLQVMGDINMFGRILAHPYSIPIIKDNRVSAWMQDHYQPGMYENPFPILESINPDMYFDHALMKNVGEYNKKVIQSNLLPFILDTLRDIPTMYEVNVATQFPESPAIYKTFQQLWVYGMVVSSLLLFLLPWVVHVFIQRRTMGSTFTLCSGLCALYFLVVSTVFGYVDASRYALASVPFLLFYIAGVFDILLYRKQKKL